MENKLICDYVDDSVKESVVSDNNINVPKENKNIQVTLNGFTFTRSPDGTDNIQAVLKNRDNKSLAGIVKQAKKTYKLVSTKPGIAEFVLHIQEETEKVYEKQKASKKNIKKRFNPTVHTLGI